MRQARDTPLNVRRAPDTDRERGFTMTELVVVIVILGIISAVALPRFFSQTSDIDAAGFRDATLSLLRYAQKAAIAQRRDVCVSFTASSAALHIAANPGNGATCATNLAGTDGRIPASVTAPSGISFAATPATFTFHALGDTTLGSDLSFAVSGATGTLTVARSTGYVSLQ